MAGSAPPTQCDVVVIGAGMGGLTSAALLAKAGLDVCVVEAEAHPGGYLAGFRRKKFLFDTAVHWLNHCGPGGLVRRVFDLLGPGSPETPQLERIRRYKGEGFDYLLTTEPDLMRDALIRDFPAEEQGIRAFFAEAKVLSRSLIQLRTRMRAIEVMSLFEKSRHGLDMLRVSWRFIRYSGWSVEEGLDRYFAPDGARRVFQADEDFAACLVPIACAYADDYQVPPTGGGPELPRWLCQVLAAWDVPVVYQCRVQEVLLEGKRAVGVRVAWGKAEHEIRSKYVVAACDLEALYERMLPPGTVGEDRLAALRDADLYDSSVTISLGLDTDPRALGFGEEMLSLIDEGRTRDENRSGDPRLAAITILAPSVRDPSLAPPGKGTLMIYVKANIAFGERWRTGPDYERGEAYRAFKEEYTQAVLERVEAACAPGLRQHIEVCDTATPVSHRRWTGNRDGSIMGQRPTKANIRARLASYKTPVENLLLGGMWAEFGGGVPVAMRAGANSALLILQREKPTAFKLYCKVMDGKLDPRELTSPALRVLPAEGDARPGPDATATARAAPRA